MPFSLLFSMFTRLVTLRFVSLQIELHRVLSLLAVPLNLYIITFSPLESSYPNNYLNT